MKVHLRLRRPMSPQGNRPSAPTSQRRRALGIPLGMLLLVLVLPAVVVMLCIRMIYGVILLVGVWLIWGQGRTSVLLVTSDSPVWREYIEDEIRPRLPQSTRTLNWSERSEWNALSPRVLVFRYFGGDREFNPMVIVFRPFRWPKTFRFWRAFRDDKHGKTESLARLQRDLFDYLCCADMAR